MTRLKRGSSAKLLSQGCLRVGVRGAGAEDQGLCGCKDQVSVWGLLLHGLVPGVIDQWWGVWSAVIISARPHLKVKPGSSDEAPIFGLL